MILENNEEKRSTLWRTVLSVSSVLIIIVAVFFIAKLFTGNPLEGTWVSEDSDAMMEIRDDGEMVVDEGPGSDDIMVQYTVDTRTKVFTIYSEGDLAGSYDYNLERNTLTLTEREYGDQMEFTRR